jgi:hypothetical protein
MKEARYRRLKKMKRRILAGAGSGLVAGLILMSSTNTVLADTSDIHVAAYTQNIVPRGMHLLHRWNSPKKLNSLARKLGINDENLRNEIRSGKSVKQIFSERGIDLAQMI